MTNAKTIAIALSLAAFGRITLADQDKYTLAVPDGLSFSEFKGYESWQTIAVSATKTSVKAILGNPAAIAAFKDGIPDNGKQFPEGVQMVKIEWLKHQNPMSPYPVDVPATLKDLSFIEKDSKRFPNNHGWAFAQFDYDTSTKTFKTALTGAECGYGCHSRVASSDYIFTAFAPR